MSPISRLRVAIRSWLERASSFHRGCFALTTIFVAYFMSYTARLPVFVPTYEGQHILGIKLKVALV
jgi:hypothetical protein